MKFNVRNPYNRLRNNIIWVFLSGMTVLCIGIAGCSTGSRSLGEKWSDREIKSKINKELAHDPVFKYSDLQTQVYAGNVQLSGYVETAEQRSRAAEIASRTKGVRQVVNHVMIKPTPTGQATIRDPLGHDAGKLLVDTNSAPVQMRNLPSGSTNSIQ